MSTTPESPEHFLPIAVQRLSAIQSEAKEIEERATRERRQLTADESLRIGLIWSEADELHAAALFSRGTIDDNWTGA